MGIETGGNSMEEIAAAEAEKRKNQESVAQLAGVSMETVQAAGAAAEAAAEVQVKPVAETAEEAEKRKNQESVAQLAGVDVETVKAAGDKK